MSEAQLKTEIDFKQPEPEEFDFMKLQSVEVPVEFDLNGQKIRIKFFLRLALNSEEKLTRQKFFAQTDDEQEPKRHGYNVELLAKLSEALPTGFPKSAKLYTMPGADASKMHIYTRIKEYLSPEQPMNILICSEALNTYVTLTQNQALLFRT